MKNLTKVKFTSLIIAIAAIVVFAAVSCAPVVEPTEYDWSAVNAGRDATQNGGVNPANILPTITNGGQIWAKDEDGNDTDILIGGEIEITFPTRADVLRGEITAASLDFLSFHSFKNASPLPLYTASPLSSAYSFTVENRKANAVTLKMTINPGIDMSAATAPDGFIMRVDGKKYTYDHGLRYDVDNNGKIESPYDDWIDTVTYTHGSNYVQPGQYANNGYTLPNLTNPSSVLTATTNPAVGYFEFVANGATTNENTLRVINVGYQTTGTDAQKAARNAFYKDVGDTLAAGIKLQKLNGATWTDVGSAQYVGEATDITQGYIVIKSVTFDHQATYRLAWTGTAYTKTANDYYGVKQQLFVYSGTVPQNAARYTRTIATSQNLTANNSNVIGFLSSFPNGNYTRYSYNSDGRNNVLRIELDGAQKFWKEVSLADFKNSFKVVYATDGSIPSNTNQYVVEVGVTGIEYKRTAGLPATPAGNNILLITLDPNVTMNGNSQINSRQLYFKVNNGISVSDNASTPTVRYFGSVSGTSGFYENFAYYNVSLITPAPLPAPTGVGSTITTSLSAGQAGAITVSWTAPTGGADSYDVYYSDDGYAGYTTNTSYLVTGLEGGSYSFYVIANKDGRSSAPSLNTSSETLNISLNGSTWEYNDGTDTYILNFTSTSTVSLTSTPTAITPEDGTYLVNGKNVTITPTGTNAVWTTPVNTDVNSNTGSIWVTVNGTSQRFDRTYP